MSNNITVRPIAGDALLCELNGWKVGDILIGNEGAGYTIIMITAIGERHILARELVSNGYISNAEEGHWTLSCRDWEKLTKKDKLRLIDYYNMIKNNPQNNSEKDKLETNKDLITDGYAFYPKKCPECGRNSMEIVRPGKIQCRYCG